MSFLEKEIYIDFSYKEIKPIQANQYDKDAQTYCIHFSNDGSEYLIDDTTMAVRIKMLKPDGLAVFNDCEINDDGTVTFILTEQMCAVFGLGEFQIMIFNKLNNKIIHTVPVKIIIRKSVFNNDTVTSSYEYDALNSIITESKETNKEAVEAVELIEETNEKVKLAETIRATSEDARNSAEIKRNTNENTRKTNETTRINAESARVTAETVRQAQEITRQTTTTTAITNANSAANNANGKANNLQSKLDSHHFVLTEDKNVAGGVAGLDSGTKIPLNELYDATMVGKGIVQLVDSISSSSTTTAATPKSVKTTYDKVIGVDSSLNAEISRVTANKPIWDDKYTKNEVDNKFSALESATDWKESVATYSDISSTYPNPQDGWTVNVKDTDYTYRYSGSAWVVISANAIPKATQSVDGLLTKEDKINYDDANIKKHIHSNKSVIDGITSVLVTAWNNAVTHISDTVKHVTSAERTLWNTVNNKVDKVSGKGLTTNDYTTAEKTKLSGIASSANNYSLPTSTASTLGGVKTGSNITNASGTISVSRQNVIDALGYTPGSENPSITESYYSGKIDGTYNNVSTINYCCLKYPNGILVTYMEIPLSSSSLTVVNGALNTQHVVFTCPLPIAYVDKKYFVICNFNSSCDGTSSAFSRNYECASHYRHNTTSQIAISITGGKEFWIGSSTINIQNIYNESSSYVTASIIGRWK